MAWRSDTTKDGDVQALISDVVMQMGSLSVEEMDVEISRVESLPDKEPANVVTPEMLNRQMENLKKSLAGQRKEMKKSLDALYDQTRKQDERLEALEGKAAEAG